MLNVHNLFIHAFRLAFWALSVGVFIGGAAGVFFLMYSVEAPSPEVLAAVVVGALGLTGVLWNQRSISRRQIKAAHHEHKANVYTTFVEEIVMSTLATGADGSKKQLSDRDLRQMLQRYRNFTGKLMVWGSEEFMSSFKEFLKAGQEEKGAEVLLCLDDLLRAMRRDLGHEDLALVRGDVVKIILRNPDELDEMVAQAT